MVSSSALEVEKDFRFFLSYLRGISNWNEDEEERDRNESLRNSARTYRSGGVIPDRIRVPANRRRNGAENDEEERESV